MEPSSAGLFSNFAKLDFSLQIFLSGTAANATHPSVSMQRSRHADRELTGEIFCMYPPLKSLSIVIHGSEGVTRILVHCKND